MKQFTFNLFIRTAQGQEFIVGKKEITSNNYDSAVKIFNKQDLPFHHFCTVKCNK